MDVHKSNTSQVFITKGLHMRRISESLFLAASLKLIYCNNNWKNQLENKCLPSWRVSWNNRSFSARAECAAHISGFIDVSPSSSLCSKHPSLRDHKSLVALHAPLANVLLFISSKDEFHPVSGLKGIFPTAWAGAKILSCITPAQHLYNMI